ncbi:MAG: ATP-binding protein [Clostridia bacterium]|nr:ATP-binding protein [Clostridia bacterium]
MKELSLHILDIIQNSIRANATEIELTVEEAISENQLRISIRDNGCGMSEELLRRVRDPFTTTRTTRKAGLGIPLLEAAAVQCGGGMEILSREGQGTTVSAWFAYDHIDRAPLGNMAETVATVVSAAPEIRFVYRHVHNQKSFVFDTAEIKTVLGEVPLHTPEVLVWIREFVQEGLAEFIDSL